MGVRIKLSGSVVIHDGEGPPRYLNSAQAQVALARLVLERRGGTTRDQLADTLWPEGLPKTWSSALRSVVSRVRAFVASALPPGATPLEALGGRYLLHLPDDTVVDTEEAEAAVASAREAAAAGRHADARRLAAFAASCLRAPFLPEHDGEWVVGVRQLLLELLVSALEVASEAASCLGDHGSAVAYADEAIGRAPLRESAYRCRMTAHARGGNRAEALRTYQHVRRVLAEEVGADPAPETESAYLDLLGVSEAPGPAGPAAGAPASGPLPFVGREAELAALTEAWARAAEGVGHMVLLTGEAGVGKTRLATEAARQVVLDGGLVLTGRCERDPRVPCRPFVEAVGGYLAATPADALPGLRPSTARALGRVLPALRPAAPPVDGGGDDAAWPGRPGPEGDGDGEAPAGDLVEPLAEVVLRVAQGRRVLLVLDDLHAADGDTLRLLLWLSRRSAGTALLVIATADDGRGTSAFAAAVHDLDRGGWLFRLALGGLDEPEIRALTRRALPDTPADDRPAAHVLSADSAGNAFLLIELLRWHRDRWARGEPVDGASGLPAGVHDYAAAQLGGLDHARRDLLRAAAVAGDTFELAPAAHTAGLGTGSALDALDALLATGLVAEVRAGAGVRTEDPRYRFTHDVVRRALYEQLSDTRRRELHARMADAIELHCPTEQSHYARLLAEHRAAGAASGGDRRAVRWGWRAAARAGEDGNAAEAVRLLRQALDHVPPHDDALRAEALSHLGLAQARAGHAEAPHTLMDAAIRARRCGRLDIAGHAALGLADAGARLRSEAVAIVDDIVAVATTGGLGRRTGEGALDELTFARLVSRQAQAGRPVAGGASALAMRTLTGELTTLAGPVDLARRRLFAAELLAVAVAAGDPGHKIVASHHAAMAADMVGDPAGRDEALAAMAAALGEGDLSGDALLADHAVALAATQGRFTDAATTARRAAALAGDRFDRIVPRPGSLAGRQVLVARWLQGGSWLADHATATAPDGPAEAILLALAAGDRGQAHVLLRALATGAEPLPADDEWSHVAGLLGLVAVEVGDPTTAEAVRTLLAPHTDLACGVGYRSYVGPVAFHLGRLAVMAGDWADAERHLTAALRRLAGRRARPWIALTQFSLAQALEGRGRASDRRWVDALRAEARWTARELGLERHRLALPA